MILEIVLFPLIIHRALRLIEGRREQEQAGISLQPSKSLPLHAPPPRRYRNHPHARPASGVAQRKPNPPSSPKHLAKGDAERAQRAGHLPNATSRDRMSLNGSAHPCAIARQTWSNTRSIPASAVYAAPPSSPRDRAGSSVATAVEPEFASSQASRRRMLPVANATQKSAAP